MMERLEKPATEQWDTVTAEEWNEAPANSRRHDGSYKFVDRPAAACAGAGLV